MSSNKRNKCIKLALCSVLSLALAFQNPMFTLADKTTELEKSITEKKSQIKDAENEKKQLKNGLTNVEKVKKELQKSKADLSQYVANLDANVAEISEKIEQLKLDITNKEAEIVETEEELEEAIEVKDDQYASMKKRVQAMYEQENDYYLSLLTDADGMSDFLNRMDYIKEITEYDNKMLIQYKEVVAYVEVCKETLEAEKEVLDEAKASAEAEQKALEDLIDEKEKEIKAYEADIANKDKLIKEYEAQIAEQDAAIKELERLVAADQASLAAQRNYDGGKFAWPCPAYTRISDEYGYRIHPTLGIEKFHSGLDLAAPAGSNILAAYDGVVVGAAYNSSMGNYVMINHGDGLYTVYMHASKLAVSSGQEVKRGQVIAYVGTTGRSTGNHLHFGVRLNGSYVNPNGYL